MQSLQGALKMTQNMQMVMGAFDGAVVSPVTSSGLLGVCLVGPQPGCLNIGASASGLVGESPPRQVEAGWALAPSVFNSSVGVVGKPIITGEMGKGMALSALARMDLGCGGAVCGF